MTVHVSSPVSLEGGQTTVTCDVINKQTKGFFIVWLKKIPSGEEFEIGTNEHINDLFNKTKRYKAKLELNQNGDYSRVKFFLTISGEFQV